MLRYVLYLCYIAASRGFPGDSTASCLEYGFLVTDALM